MRPTTTRTCSPTTSRPRSGSNPCNLDTDGDGVDDGFEYQSAKDLNDDEYQNPNQFLPYPGKRPYPNPLSPTPHVTTTATR